MMMETNNRKMYTSQPIYRIQLARSMIISITLVMEDFIKTQSITLA